MEKFNKLFDHTLLKPDAKKEDVKIIKSPVGMPGRAIYNDFIKNTEVEKAKIQKCYN